MSSVEEHSILYTLKDDILNVLRPEDKLPTHVKHAFKVREVNGTLEILGFYDKNKSGFHMYKKPKLIKPGTISEYIGSPLDKFVLDATRRDKNGLAVLEDSNS